VHAIRGDYLRLDDGDALTTPTFSETVTLTIVDSWQPAAST